MPKTSCYGINSLDYERCANPEEAVRIMDCSVCNVCFSALETLALEDPLTGLPNRRALKMEYRQTKEDGLVTAAAMLDIKNFGYVNTLLGHDIGDQFLQRAAVILRNSTRNEVFTGREGGDEFALLVKFVDRQGIPLINPNTEEIMQTISNRITNNFNEDEVFLAYNTFVPDDKKLGIRLGYAFPRDDMEWDALLSHADVKGVETRSESDPRTSDHAETIKYMLATESVKATS